MDNLFEKLYVKNIFCEMLKVFLKINYNFIGLLFI